MGPWWTNPMLDMVQHLGLATFACLAFAMLAWWSTRGVKAKPHSAATRGGPPLLVASTGVPVAAAGTLPAQQAGTEPGTAAKEEEQGTEPGRKTPRRRSWFACCTGGRESSEDEALERALPEELCRRSVAHPKWCGLRHGTPSEELPLPNCMAFSPDLDNTRFGWHELRCDAGERERGRELEKRIEGVPGPKDPITLLRYVRARQGNVGKAAEMYQRAMQWRGATQEYEGFRSGVMDDSLHRRMDEHWKNLGLLGRDREGDAVAIVREGVTDMGACDQVPLSFLIKHEIYTCIRMHQALEELGQKDGKPHMYFTVIFDLWGLGLQHLNLPALQKYKACVRIGEDYFPAIVKRVVIVRPPWVFPHIWAVAKHFFDAGTREKISIVKAQDTFKVLNTYVESCWIPENLGGSLRIEKAGDCWPVIPRGGPMPSELLKDILAEYGS